MSLIELLEEKKQNLISRKTEQKKRHKKAVADMMIHKLEDADIELYRKLIYIETNGLVGLDYGECDIKQYVLTRNKKLFEEEDYFKYMHIIIPNSCGEKTK